MFVPVGCPLEPPKAAGSCPPPREGRKEGGQGREEKARMETKREKKKTCCLPAPCHSRPWWLWPWQELMPALQLCSSQVQVGCLGPPVLCMALWVNELCLFVEREKKKKNEKGKRRCKNWCFFCSRGFFHISQSGGEKNELKKVIITTILIIIIIIIIPIIMIIVVILGHIWFMCVFFKEKLFR